MGHSRRQRMQRSQLIPDADSLFQREPVGNILGLQNDAGRFCTVPCELGLGLPDGVRGPVLVLVGQIFLTDMLVMPECSFKHRPDVLSLGKDGFVRVPEQILRRSFEYCLCCRIDRSDHAAGIYREQSGRNALENLSCQSLHFFESTFGAVIVEKNNNRRDSDRTHQEYKERHDDQVAAGLPERRDQLRGNRLALSKTLQEEILLLQTKEQNDRHNQGQDQEDGHDEPIGNPSEKWGFWSRSKHSCIACEGSERNYGSTQSCGCIPMVHPTLHLARPYVRMGNGMAMNLAWRERASSARASEQIFRRGLAQRFSMTQKHGCN